MNIEVGGLRIRDQAIDHAVVGGRVFVGPVRVGTRFSRVAEAAAEFEPTSSTRIDLRVVRIDLYGHDVDVLDQGVSGWLELQGVGGEALRDGMVLSTEPVSGLELRVDTEAFK